MYVLIVLVVAANQKKHFAAVDLRMDAAIVRICDP
jgi:hypothetical protein